MRTFLTLSFVFSCLLSMQGQAVAASICDGTAGNLVLNCGFETGDLTSWTVAGNDTPLSEGVLYGGELGADPFDSILPNSGAGQAFVADLVANATMFSQVLATTPGDTYAVSFYLAQDTAPGGLCGAVQCSNELQASFDGISLVATSAIPVEGYTQYSYTETAADASSTFSITLGNDLGQFLVDDVVVADTTVASTPEPSAWLLMLAACGITGVAGVKKFRRSAI
jgi:hypothetical protein